MKRTCGPLPVAAVLLLWHGIAQAQALPAGSSPAQAGTATLSATAPDGEGEGEASDDSARLPSAGPAGPDWRTGHLIVTGKVGAAIPAGTTTGDVAARDLVGDGIGFGGSIGIGISRHMVLALSSSYALLPGASACETHLSPATDLTFSCSGRSLSASAEFVYHLAQGIAFDPWVSFGAGYRWSHLMASRTGAGDKIDAASPAGIGQYHGLDFLRLGLGGDFYPVPSFGFGGYLDSGVGTYRVRPTGGASVYAFVEVGVRIAFDPLRWNWTPARSQVAWLR